MRAGIQSPDSWRFYSAPLLQSALPLDRVEIDLQATTWSHDETDVGDSLSMSETIGGGPGSDCPRRPRWVGDRFHKIR